MRVRNEKGFTLLEIVTTVGAVVLLSTFSFKLFSYSVERYVREDKAQQANLGRKELLSDLEEDLRKVMADRDAKTFETPGIFERDQFKCTHKASGPSICKSGLEIPQITLLTEEGRTENGRKSSKAQESKVVYLTECVNLKKDSEKRKPIHDKLFCTSGRSKLYRRFYPDAKDEKYVQKTYEDAEGFGALCFRDCEFFVTELGHSTRNAAGVVQIKQETHYFFRRPVKSPGNIIK